MLWPKKPGKAHETGQERPDSRVDLRYGKAPQRRTLVRDLVRSRGGRLVGGARRDTPRVGDDGSVVLGAESSEFVSAGRAMTR